MKTKILIIPAIIFVYSAIQSKKIDDSFLQYFKKANLPINTTIYNKFFEQRLPEQLSLKYIFDGDSNSFFYNYEIYSDDENKITSSGRKPYSIAPLDHFKINDIDFITYYKGSINESPGSYLAILNNNGVQSDNLIVYQENNENELYNWTRGIIFKDSIILINYKLKSKEKNHSTEITVSKLAVNFSTLRFYLIDEKKHYSNYLLYEFYDPKDAAIKNEDPFYNYVSD